MEGKKHLCLFLLFFLTSVKIFIAVKIILLNGVKEQFKISFISRAKSVLKDNTATLFFLFSLAQGEKIHSLIYFLGTLSL